MSKPGTLPPEPETMRLVSHGRLSWPDILAELAGMEVAWTDLGGFHLGEPPTEVPIGTHVWGWAADKWARVRLDGAEGILGTLHATAVEDLSDQVRVTRRVMLGWGDEARIPGRNHGKGRTFEALEVETLLPYSFVAGT